MNLADLFIAKKLAGGGGGGTGTDNYNDLSNKPQINSTALTGDKSASDLGLQSEIDSDNKISADYVDDTSASNKFVSAAEKLEWSGKQDAIDADHKIDADYVDDTTSDNKFVTASDKTAWNAKQNAIDSSHKLSSDLVDDTGHTNLFVTSTEKSTWTGKQDKIDSSHKLSSTLVSFDSSEAAALASGIDSTKVSQIATNQTNILYAIDNGGKNKFNCDPIVLQPMNTVGTWSGNTYTVSSKTFTINNGEVTLSGGLDQYNTARMVIFKGDIPAGTKITGCPAGGATSGIDSYCIGVYDSNDYFVTADIGNGVSIPNDLTNVTVCVTRARGAMSSSLVFKPMLCTVDAWNISHEFVPCSLPNYDLTRLEAEDRAGLVECVDGGAKNLYDLSDANVAYNRGMSTRTITSSTGTIALTSDGTLSWSRVGMKVTLPAGSYVYSGKITTAAANGRITSSTDINDSAQGTEVFNPITANTTKSFDVAFTLNSQTTFYIFYYTNFVESTTAASITVANNMLATKAAFGVSQKFVPYKQPERLLIHDDNTTQSNSFTFNVASVQKGTYFMTIDGSSAPTNRSPASLYLLSIFTSGDLYVLVPVKESTGNTISNHSISGTTVTFNLDATKFHSVRLLTMGFWT